MKNTLISISVNEGITDEIVSLKYSRVERNNFYKLLLVLSIKILNNNNETCLQVINEN